MEAEIFATYFLWTVLIVAIFISAVTYLTYRCLKDLQTRDIEKSDQFRQAYPVMECVSVQSLRNSVTPATATSTDSSEGSPATATSTDSSEGSPETDCSGASPSILFDEQDRAIFYHAPMIKLIPAMVKNTKTKPQKNGEEVGDIWERYQELNRKSQPRFVMKRT